MFLASSTFSNANFVIFSIQHSFSIKSIMITKSNDYKIQRTPHPFRCNSSSKRLVPCIRKGCESIESERFSSSEMSNIISQLPLLLLKIENKSSKRCSSNPIPGRVRYNFFAFKGTASAIFLLLPKSKLFLALH